MGWMNDGRPDAGGRRDQRLRAISATIRREHEVWTAAIDRATGFASVIELLCDCSRFGNLEWQAGDADHHHWRCTAGIVEYWCSRHPAAVADWLGQIGLDPPAPPVW